MASASAARAPARAATFNATDIANAYMITTDAPRTAGQGVGPLSRMTIPSAAQFASATPSVIDVVSGSCRVVIMAAFDQSVVFVDITTTRWRRAR